MPNWRPDGTVFRLTRSLGQGSRGVFRSPDAGAFGVTGRGPSIAGCPLMRRVVSAYASALRAAPGPIEKRHGVGVALDPRGSAAGRAGLSMAESSALVSPAALRRTATGCSGVPEQGPARPRVQGRRGDEQAGGGGSSDADMAGPSVGLPPEQQKAPPMARPVIGKSGAAADQPFCWAAAGAGAAPGCPGCWPGLARPPFSGSS